MARALVPPNALSLGEWLSKMNLYSSDWVTSQEASVKLGFSEKSLRCWCECGYLKNGKHWHRNEEKDDALFFYQVELCKQEMSSWWGRDAFVGP